MSTLVPREPVAVPVRLDRPQRWGFLPTLTFWQRRDVWRIVGLPAGIFVFAWLVVVDLALVASIPWWASAAFAALGPVLFIGLMERYVRARMQHRRAIGATSRGE